MAVARRWDNKGNYMKEKPETEQKPEAETPLVPDDSLKPKEIGGPKGPEPTRYGDWEKAGRCIDF